MNKIILHIDFNSYFATVEQQANPRLRGKPIGVTGGDRMKRTVIGAASVEAKRFGVRTGMHPFEARKLCPEIILVKGDSDKYLETTKKFLNILKDYSPDLEVFSIDEVFLELPSTVIARSDSDEAISKLDCHAPLGLAMTMKQRIKAEIGEWMKCSIGISYNKVMAKLAGSLYKPDGLVMIADEQAAQWVLDRVGLDEICGVGFRIKKRLNNMGIFNFKDLRKVPLPALLASFKSYGQTLYNMSRGIDHSEVVPFYEKEEVKSIGHRHTIDHDTNDPQEIKQILLKLTELIARRLRSKKLVGKTVSCWFRYALNPTSHHMSTSEVGVIGHLGFNGNGMQTTINTTQDGLDIFNAAWRIFHQIWNKGKIRMIGVSISNLQSSRPQNLSLLSDDNRKELINKTLDEVNQKYGEFTLQRGVLLGSSQIRRKANPFISDRRFKHAIIAP